MKKTITAILAASTCVFGAEETFDATKTATISLTLDVEEMAKISDVSFNGDAATKPNFFMFDGTWSAKETGKLGLANNGSSGSDKSGFWGSWVKGTGTGNATETGLGDIFTASTDWTSIEAISLVYSYSTPDSGATTATLAVSILYSNGKIETKADSKSNIVFNGQSGFSSTSVWTNDTYVASFDVDSTQALGLDAAKNLSVQMLPEPTTATLSLLALAGLAARRRRK